MPNHTTHPIQGSKQIQIGPSKSLQTSLNKLFMGAAVLLLTSLQPLYAQTDNQPNVHADGTMMIELSSEQQAAMGLVSEEIQTVGSYPLITVNAQAMFALDQQYSVNSPLAGKVIAIHHIHGAVAKGDVLIEIQSPEWIELQAELLSTQIELNAAEQNLKRALALSKSGASSSKNVSLARVEAAKWQSKKSMVKAVLRSAGMTDDDLNRLISTQQIDASNLKLVAQSAGQFYDLKVKVGQMVEQGESLALLGADQQMVLDAPVPIKLAQQLEEGQEVALPEVDKKATITHIHNVADAQTQTVDVHIRVDSSDVKLLAGQMMPVAFYQQSEQPILQVPSAALSKLEGEMVIYLPSQQSGQQKVSALRVSLLKSEKGFSYIQPLHALPQAAEGQQKVFTKGSAALKAAFSAGEEE